MPSFWNLPSRPYPSCLLWAFLTSLSFPCPAFEAPNSDGQGKGRGKERKWDRPTCDSVRAVSMSGGGKMRMHMKVTRAAVWHEIRCNTCPNPHQLTLFLAASASLKAPCMASCPAQYDDRNLRMEPAIITPFFSRRSCMHVTRQQTWVGY